MNTSTLHTTALAYQRRSVTRVMLHVMLALLPGICLYALLIDERIVGNLLKAGSAALLFEAALLGLRKRAVKVALCDGSIVLASTLLVLSVPQSLPTWQLVFGIFIMCTLGKHVFGGLGHNPFNPAMVAYAVLIISFPLSMTQWSTDQGFLDTKPLAYDGVSSATPLEKLDQLRQLTPSTLSTSGHPTQYLASDTDSQSEKITPSQVILQSAWTPITLAWLLGGCYLLIVRIISWRIPFTVLGSLWCAYLVYGSVSVNPTVPATVALLSGALMLGAFFIATDPVSSAASNPGKIIYGVGVGLLCFVIREFSHYPEGFAFAVLLMNMCVPLIDHAFTRNNALRHQQLTMRSALENRGQAQKKKTG